jgi:hypothetical protein
MSRPPHEPLEHALSLSQRMLVASERGEWDTVRSLHDELAQSLKTVGPPTEQTRHAFLTLAGQQQRIQGHVRAAQRGLEQQLSQQKYNQRAVQAYLAPHR